jgi:hypothetical protein
VPNSSEDASGLGVNRDFALLLGRELEGNGAIDQREEREVLANAHVVAGSEGLTDLTNDDAAGVDGLTTKHLHTTVLSAGIAPIAS